MEQNGYLYVKNSNVSIKLEKENVGNYDVVVKIEPVDDLHIEDSTVDFDYQIKEEIDIGPTVLYRPNMQYQLSDTLETPSVEQPLSKENQSISNCNSQLKTAIEKPKDKLKRSKQKCEKSYTCEICSIEFTFVGNYTRHIRETHSDNKFKCGNCSKTFKRLYKLKNHQRSGVRCNVRRGEFKCHCGKYFNNKSNMYRHILGYCESKRYEGMFICAVCGKEFPNKIRLSVHIGHHKRVTNVLK